MTKKKPKIEYCLYKEYWFGRTKEAQMKPAGFKYKRGTLVKPKKQRSWVGDYLTSYTNIQGGVANNAPRDLKANDLFLVLGYDSEYSQVKLFAKETDRERTLVPSIAHTFTFLCGEKIVKMRFEVWGDYIEKDIQNKIWQKARKSVVRPTRKKKKKPGQGFTFDNYIEEDV